MNTPMNRPMNTPTSPPGRRKANTAVRSTEVA